MKMSEEAFYRVTVATVKGPPKKRRAVVACLILSLSSRSRDETGFVFSYLDLEYSSPSAMERTSALSAHHMLHLAGAPPAVGLLTGRRAGAGDAAAEKAMARRERRGAAGAAAGRGGGGRANPKT
jgi:hypothetical protein